MAEIMLAGVMAGLLFLYYITTQANMLEKCKIEGWNFAVHAWKATGKIPETPPSHPGWKKACQEEYEKGFWQAIEKIKQKNGNA